MKDNTLRETVHERILQAKDECYYNGRNAGNESEGDYGTWQDWEDLIEALLAEEVRKVKIEELELILNGYGWGEGEEAANFIIKDRIAELEKGK